MVYTAVPPGVDVSDRCVARMAREVLTDNPEDCEYVIRLFDVNDLDWGWYGNYVDVQCADDSTSRLLDLSEEFERNNEPAQCAWDELRLGTTFRYPRTVLQTTEIPGATTTIAQVTSDASGRLTTMLQTSTMPPSKVTLTFGPVPAPAPISTAPPAAIVTTQVVLTDSLGKPTQTLTNALPPGVFLIPKTIPLLDSSGSTTAFFTTTIPYLPTTRTLFDSLGNPTATTTELVPYITPPPGSFSKFFCFFTPFFFIQTN